LNSPQDADARALRLDEYLNESIAAMRLPSPKQLTTEIRSCLFERTKAMAAENNVHRLLRTKQDRHGEYLILLGPTFDKEPMTEHFQFDSGARLSFGITVREEGQSSFLIAYRFHYHLPPGSMPAFLRMDLINRPHKRVLHEPRCHLHPGSDGIRFPLPALSPIEVLDRIFFVIEPSLLGDT
jgi:hypothetical protein